jgi:hypothetical protein
MSNQDSTLKSYVDSATGYAQSALGSLTGSAGDKVIAPHPQTSGTHCAHQSPPIFTPIFWGGQICHTSPSDASAYHANPHQSGLLSLGAYMTDFDDHEGNYKHAYQIITY